jgi:hypothetical protein
MSEGSLDPLGPYTTEREGGREGAREKVRGVLRGRRGVFVFIGK